MLVVPIVGVGYNSKSYQICLANILDRKSGEFVIPKIELNQNKYI